MKIKTYEGFFNWPKKALSPKLTPDEIKIKSFFQNTSFSDVNQILYNITDEFSLKNKINFSFQIFHGYGLYNNGNKFCCFTELIDHNDKFTNNGNWYVSPNGISKCIKGDSTFPLSLQFQKKILDIFSLPNFNYQESNFRMFLALSILPNSNISNFDEIIEETSDQLQDMCNFSRYEIEKDMYSDNACNLQIKFYFI